MNKNNINLHKALLALLTFIFLSYVNSQAMLLPFLGEEDSQEGPQQIQMPQPIERPQPIQQVQQDNPQSPKSDEQVDLYNFFKNKNATPNSRQSLVGCFTIENSSKNKIPEFKICYDGKYTYSNKDGFFFIPLDQKRLEKYYILICKNFRQDFKCINTIDHLNAFSDKNYKLFSFKQNRRTGGRWVQKEKDFSKKKFSIPQHCITILVDPKYVDHVENWQIALPNNFTKLPKIVLKDSENLDKESRKSLLYTLDSNVFHEKTLAQKKAVPNAKVEVQIIP